MTSSIAVVNRQIQLKKKRGKLKARRAFAKAESIHKHAFEIVKEKSLKASAAKLNAYERLSTLSQRGLLVAVSSKAASLFP